MFSKYIIGLDLGQQNDYTVLTVVEPITSPLEGVKYHVPYMYRYPLKTSYVYIVEHVRNFIEMRQLEDYLLVVDHTGVGIPIVDLFNEHSINLVGITITGGHKANWHTPRSATVPKQELISCLQMAMQCKKMQISKDIGILDVLIKEFIGFTARITKSGKGKFEAEHGVHDDTVLSLAMAIWYCESRLKKSKRIRAFGGS